jgi:hypothetical protein
LLVFFLRLPWFLSGFLAALIFSSPRIFLCGTEQ